MQISRSEQKRRVKEVETLVAKLVTLPHQVLKGTPCSDEVHALLDEARTLEGKPRQRHIKYITKLVQLQPLEPLYAFVGKYQGKGLAEKKQFHEVELYRDGVINEAIEEQIECQQSGAEWHENWQSATLAELQLKLPGLDVPAVGKLAYLFVQTRNPRHSREIFRHLQAAFEQQQRMQGKPSEG